MPVHRLTPSFDHSLRRLLARRVLLRLLRLPKVARTIGVSRATFYRCVGCGRLLRPVKVSTRCIAWRATEITALFGSCEPQAELCKFRAP
jgi:predicted DNA-binding transcriptional regulator AlpA